MYFMFKQVYVRVCYLTTPVLPIHNHLLYRCLNHGPSLQCQILQHSQYRRSRLHQEREKLVLEIFIAPHTLRI